MDWGLSEAYSQITAVALLWVAPPAHTGTTSVGAGDRQLQLPWSQGWSLSQQSREHSSPVEPESVSQPESLPCPMLIEAGGDESAAMPSLAEKGSPPASRALASRQCNIMRTLHLTAKAYQVSAVAATTVLGMGFSGRGGVCRFRERSSLSRATVPQQGFLPFWQPALAFSTARAKSRLATLKPERKSYEKRSPLWSSKRLQTLRRAIIQRAGRLTQPSASAEWVANKAGSK